ncbi:protein kinase domain-containing protein [Methylomonas koyamae]|uniref:protein kinase domain-containing protein n=1 Tax=Methylomonas koyamae TaxID=702114 RepID=UPI0009ED1CB0|nr:protein kinase [Methylomonas koyamae]
MGTASEYLVGEVVDGWEVEERIKSYPGATGGHFSVSYIVTKNGAKAFLKAMDLHAAIKVSLDEVQRVVTQYNFEKSLLTLCRDKNLSKIIRLISDGEHVIQKLPSGSSHDLNRVYYLIFELADGDIRKELRFNGEASNAVWKAHVLHQIAVALTQLHSNKIAHQDLKPSNVLSFNNDKTCKLADLGRSSSMNIPAPTDVISFPGDFNYAPPEYLYNHVPSDFHDRRFSSDAYLLGSMISFLFTGLSALTLTIDRVDGAFKPDAWVGNYSDVLPYLITAHTEVTNELKQYLPTDCKDEISNIYFQLCHPDPYTRGHPKARKQVGRPIGIDRYVSKFNLLTHKLRCIKSSTS